MPTYEVKLKRKTTPIIKIMVNGNKFALNNSADFFDASRTCSAIISIINMMEKEGLEWIRVQVESP